MLALAARRGRAPALEDAAGTLADEPLAAAGRPEEARRAAADGGGLDARRAWGYRDAAVRVLRRLGDRPRLPAPPPSGSQAGDGRPAALTRREREVAALVAEGQTNAQIAARQHLSESTVEKHVSHVLGKLGMASRAGIVRLLARKDSPAE